MMIRENGFTLMSVPVLVRESRCAAPAFSPPAASRRTASAKSMRAEMFRFLTGTAEVGLTALPHAENEK